MGDCRVAIAPRNDGYESFSNLNGLTVSVRSNLIPEFGGTPFARTTAVMQLRMAPIPAGVSYDLRPSLYLEAAFGRGLITAGLPHQHLDLELLPRAGQS